MKITTRAQLSVMMFLNYFVWGSWYVTMGTFLAVSLEASGTEIGLAYTATAIAAMISPFFVGLVADRFFASERVLGVTHLLGALFMYLAATASSFAVFFPLLILYTLTYMPSLALTNAISFHQMNDPGQEFPAIRVWGTIGWIIAGLVILILQSDLSFGLSWDFPYIFEATQVKNIESTAIPLKMAAIIAVVMGVYSFALPHTPPKSKGENVDFKKLIGLDALKLLTDRSFLILFLASMAICIPLSFYYSFANPFLNEVGFENAAGRMTLGQMSEMVFLIIMPFFFVRLGVKKMMMIGMAAWALRYVLFAFGDPEGMVWMLYAGIVLHGICYDFFFVTGQIYADNEAPLDLRSSVQGMMTFATYGVGMFIGSLASGWVVDMFATPGEALPHDWKGIWMIPAAFALVVMLVFVLLFKDKVIKGQEA